MAGMSSQGNGAAVGLRALSMCIGVFLILQAMGKIGWFFDSGSLTGQLEEWRAILGSILAQEDESGPLGWLANPWRDLTMGYSLRYLETVAIPYAGIFARIVPLAEFAAGAALVTGFNVRLTAGLALLMVLNFHFASGILFTWSYLTNGYGPPVVGSLLALAIGGRTLPFRL